MRKLFYLLLLAALISSCGSDSEKYGQKVIIKGHISASTASKSSLLRNGNALTLADATKVLIYYGLNYEIVDIVDSSFSAPVVQGNATAFLFLTEDYQYIGNLYAAGLNMLPLIDLENNTVIDLKSLVLDGTSVIPTHDPIGNEIKLTEDEIASLKDLGGFFEDLATNMDANQNGKPDILEKKDLIITSGFELRSGNGKWGLDKVAPIPVDLSTIRIGYSMIISGPATMIINNDYSKMKLSGPVGNPYPAITHIMNYSEGMTGFNATFSRFNLNNNVPEPFEKGTYQFTLDGDTLYTLKFSNIAAERHMIIGIPTLHLSPEGNVSNVTLEWVNAQNKTIDPYKIITNLDIVFHYESTGNMQSYTQWGSLNITDPFLRPIKDFYTIESLNPVKYSDVIKITVGYQDILGNGYDVRWYPNQ